jgi:hypothetical protein
MAPSVDGRFRCRMGPYHSMRTWKPKTADDALSDASAILPLFLSPVNWRPSGDRRLIRGQRAEIQFHAELTITPTCISKATATSASNSRRTRSADCRGKSKSRRACCACRFESSPIADANRIGRHSMPYEIAPCSFILWRFAHRILDVAEIERPVM